ncbi:Transcriptional regulator, TetR family [Bacillus cereus]|nr:Transcriptional regulator, TetR family [Bacillus cereus]
MRSRSFHYVFSHEKYDKQSITTITGAISKVIKGWQKQ